MLVLSDRVYANHPSATDRARRTSDHAASVRAQARAIVKAARVVETLNDCLERGHSAPEEGTKLHTALDGDIQADDGGLVPDCVGTPKTNAAMSLSWRQLRNLSSTELQPSAKT